MSALYPFSDIQYASLNLRCSPDQADAAAPFRETYVVQNLQGRAQSRLQPATGLETAGSAASPSRRDRNSYLLLRERAFNDATNLGSRHPIVTAVVSRGIIIPCTSLGDQQHLAL